MFARRWLFNLIAAVCCFALFGFAVFSQYHWGLQPCPLCIFQRIAAVALGCAFLLAAAVPQRARALSVIAAGLIGAAALAGAIISARHLYIQSLPPGSVPACGATLDYMWEVFPALDVLKKVLTGSGECAKVDWRFLGLAMPGWVLIWMIGLGVTGVAVNLRRRR